MGVGQILEVERGLQGNMSGDVAKRCSVHQRCINAICDLLSAASSPVPGGSASPAVVLAASRLHEEACEVSRLSAGMEEDDRRLGYYEGTGRPAIEAKYGILSDSLAANPTP